MDHQAFAQLLGNYGEFVGAIAVVVTLVYLAVQIRASTLQARATMVHSIVESFNGSHHVVMQNPQIAEVYAKIRTGEELTAAEAVQWESCVNRIFNTYSSIQRAYDTGQIDQHYYETCCIDVARSSVQYGWADSMRELLSHFPDEASLEIFAGLYPEQ